MKLMRVNQVPGDLIFPDFERLRNMGREKSRISGGLKHLTICLVSTLLSSLLSYEASLLYKATKEHLHSSRSQISGFGF